MLTVTLYVAAELAATFTAECLYGVVMIIKVNAIVLPGIKFGHTKAKL